MIDSAYIKKLVFEAGFDLCGITPARHFATNEGAFREWLERGFDSSLGYMRNYLDRRFDVRALVDGARSVVVCAVSYRSEISEGYDAECRTKIASYACNCDYHKSVKRMLTNVLRQLQERYPTLSARVFVDSAPLLEKQLAVEAGLGWIGRQSLLVTPEFGSFVLLGELVLCDEVDSYDTPYEGVDCGECHRCVDACPTGAIVEPMVINTSRCISCRTIESEADAATDLHGWIFGCDECQSCCPYNMRAHTHRNTAFNPIFSPLDLSPQEWMAMSEGEFADRFGTTPLKRSGLQRLKQSVALNLRPTTSSEE